MLSTPSPLAANDATAGSPSLNAIAQLVQQAAIKNGQFSGSRSNSLVQTLLQRRHWYNLLALRKLATLQAAAARATPGGPARPAWPAWHEPADTSLPANCGAVGSTTPDAPRADTPTPQRRKRAHGPSTDGGERGGDGLVLVLADGGEDASKRRRSTYCAARKNREVFGLR